MSKFTALLSSMAMSELRSLHDYFQSSRDALSQSPSSLDQLAEVVNLHKKLYEEKKRTEARFEPLREKFKVRGACSQPLLPMGKITNVHMFTSEELP